MPYRALKTAVPHNAHAHVYTELAVHHNATALTKRIDAVLAEWPQIVPLNLQRQEGCINETKLENQCGVHNPVRLFVDRSRLLMDVKLEPQLAGS